MHQYFFDVEVNYLETNALLINENCLQIKSIQRIQSMYNL